MATAQDARDTDLPEVRVEQTREAERRIDRTQSITILDAEDLARRQPASVFEALRDVPGVSINGGPRPSGMKFNIRGYSDTEDVVVKLDGVVKNFEKYRFGGTFIEPELLRSIEVQRGPQIASGSGALGGTVIATTKDAADLLFPGARFGVRGRVSYATNNDEKLWSASAFGRPTETSDVLFNAARRWSNDITVPDGSALPFSAADTQSWLAKGSVFLGDALQVGASNIVLDDTGRQPYDATGGQPGVFGTVTRGVSDRTLTGFLRYSPESRWIDLRVTGGRVRTTLDDLIRPGESVFANSLTGNIRDHYDYDITTLDIANTAAIGALGEFRLRVLAGLQYNDNTRDVTRVTQNAFINRLLYPGGFNPAQPPGRKANRAAYVQPRLQAGRLELVPGLRWDEYRVEAAGGTLDQLQRFGEAPEIRFDRLSPSFGAALTVIPDRMLVFYNYAEAFRPPLIDEYFTQGAFSRCIPFFLGALAPRSGICGGLYRPEESTAQEAGVTLTLPLAGRGIATAKLVHFWNRTTQLLESITVVRPGVVGQPGVEDRRGTEIEVRADYRSLFARLGYAWIRGRVDDGRAVIGLYDVPGDTLALSLGGRPVPQVELAYNFLDVGERDAVVGLAANRLVIGRQPGYRLHGASIRVFPSRHLELAVIGDNLGNERYFLNDGFGGGIGSVAPGRSVRFVMVAAF